MADVWKFSSWALTNFTWTPKTGKKVKSVLAFTSFWKTLNFLKNFYQRYETYDRIAFRNAFKWRHANENEIKKSYYTK